MFVNRLLKKEIGKINRVKRSQTLAFAFKKASKDKKRQSAIRE